MPRSPAHPLPPPAVQVVGTLGPAGLRVAGRLSPAARHRLDVLCYTPDDPRCPGCGHRYSAQEQQAGFTTCEHCPPAAVTS